MAKRAARCISSSGDGVSYCRIEVDRLRQSPFLILLFAVALGGCDKSSTAPSGPTPQTIAELFLSNPVQIFPVQLAQSVTLPAGGAYNTIRFRWMLAPGAGPLTGSLYILGQEYLGRVSGVGTAPGLIARSIRIEGDEYVFDAAVTLSGGTKYWFAADSPVGFLCSQSTSDIYAGGDLYTIGGTAGAPGDPAYARFYVNSPNERLDASFSLRGVRVP